MMVGKPSGRNPHKSSARNLKFSIDSLGEAVELCETQCAVICFTEMLPLRKWSVSWESSNIFWIWMYISIHIIDYIGLCTYTSTCLYILLICMYIHIYIYTLYTVYICIYTRALGIQLHATPSTHDFLQSTEVIFTQKLPARCRLSWASQPFRIVQTADVAIATPAVSSRCSHIMSTVIWMSTVFAERLQSFLQIFVIQTLSRYVWKKTPSLKYELHPAKHPKVDTVQIPCFALAERYWLVTNLPSLYNKIRGSLKVQL